MIKIYLEEGAIVPTRAHPADAGLDIKSPIDFIVKPNGSVAIDTGVHAIIPKGYCGVLISKSGLNVKYDITSTGLIDAGYSGEIMVKLYNHGFKTITIKAGEKISQLVVLPCLTEKPEIITVDELLEIKSERGDKGFGSTGR